MVCLLLRISPEEYSDLDFLLGGALNRELAWASLMMLTVTTGGDMCTFSLVPTSNLTVAENLVLVLRTCERIDQIKILVLENSQKAKFVQMRTFKHFLCQLMKPKMTINSRVWYLRRLLLDHERGLDQGVEQHGEAIAQLGQDVHGQLLAGDVERLLDHLQLSDLLHVDPDDLGQVLAPLLDRVQVVGEGRPVAGELLITFPPAQLLVEDAELEVLELLDHVQVVVGKIRGLQLQVVELQRKII